MARKVVWSSERISLPAMRRSVVDMYSTSMTEAVGLATLIWARQ